MRLLIVGFADSVHIARYLQLLEGSGWDIHLFDSNPFGQPHPELPRVTLYTTVAHELPPGSPVQTAPMPVGPTTFAAQADELARVLEELRPDIVHSHEIQHAGALVAAVRDRPGVGQIPWIVTNWGSDILWWGRHPSHVPTIKRVLSACDYYSAECHRDVALARAYGLRGEVVGVWPVTGGIDLEHAIALQVPGPTSRRRAISVKGVVGPNGQGEVAFAALERCRGLLQGWEICGYQMHTELDERYRALSAEGQLRYTTLSMSDARQSSHDDLLCMHGRSRVSLGLNRSDGLSTSFLEAMAMGSFPVQASGSCGNEITPDGRGALFVPATDVDAVEAALRRALTDDGLVDRGAAINRRAAAEHLDRHRTRNRVLDMYERIGADSVIGAS